MVKKFFDWLLGEEDNPVQNIFDLIGILAMVAIFFLILNLPRIIK